MKLGDATVLLYLAPLFTAIFSKIVFRERFGVVNFCSTFACLLGLIFVSQPQMLFGKYSDTNSVNNINSAVAVTGAITLGICYTSVRVQNTAVSPQVYLLWMFFMVLPGSVAIEMATKHWYTLPHCGHDRFWVMISGVLMLSSYYVFIRALAVDNIATTTLMRNLDVVIGYVIQRFWFNEKVDVLTLLGLIMIIGGVSAVFIHKLTKNTMYSTQVQVQSTVESPTTQEKPAS